MAWLPFKFNKVVRSFLGIDIGTSSIRVVELTRKGKDIHLTNYGEIKTSSPLRNVLLFSNQEVARAIAAILREADIKSREVNFSIPDFSSFFTSFELPPMSRQELEAAVRYEARSHIPLPLSDITLDWQVSEGELLNKTKKPLKVLVVAVPNSVISQYQKIASFSQLEIKALEAEIFALSRPLVKNEEMVLAIIDIGARSTTCNILEKGNLKISHSFNISGNELTEVLSRSMKIDYEKAEELKKIAGLLGVEGVEKDVRKICLPLIDAILAEIKKTFQSFRQRGGNEVQKIILSGGSALMPGLKEYFSEEFGKEVEIANPFANISFPPILGDILKEMAPSYAVAVGLAMKGFE
jgi:type IV pilus assembly protein PilM